MALYAGQQTIGHRNDWFQIHGTDFYTARITGPQQYMRERGRALIHRMRRGHHHQVLRYRKRATTPPVSLFHEALLEDFIRWEREQFRRTYVTPDLPDFEGHIYGQL